MRSFGYARPTSLDQALDLLSREDVAALAGGSDLLALMKDDVLAPGRLVGIAHLEELRGVARERADGGEQLVLGAGLTMSALSSDETVRRALPALAAVAGEVGGPQVREAATLGGNLCQWPRCWYFRSGEGLLARRDGRSLVREGENRWHAVFGTDQDALYVHPSTVAPLLAALDARVRVRSRRDAREVALSDLLVVPKTDAERPVALAPGELVTHVVVPLTPGRHAGFHEVRQKAAMDWPLVTAAVVLERSAGVVRSPRVVLGHVAAVPHRAEAAERVLDGAVPNDDVLARAGEAATRGARPLSRNGYKLRLIRVATARAVRDALEAT